MDASKIRDYYMLNTTDSNYSQVIPVEYPKVVNRLRPPKIGVVSIDNGYPLDGHRRRPGAELPAPHGSLGRFERTYCYNNSTANGRKANSSTAMVPMEAAITGPKTTSWVDLNSARYFRQPGGWQWVNKGLDLSGE